MKIKNKYILEYNKFNEELDTLKAPNGQKSNLTEKQWHQVRTPEFKAWFGDWENDPKNASKVVDENGEPLVVYHGTNAHFNSFSEEKLGKSTNVEWCNFGFFFTPDSELASKFTKGKRWSMDGYKYKRGSNVIQTFLSISNPLHVKIYEALPLSNIKGSVVKFKQDAIKNNYNGVILGTWEDSFGTNDKTGELGNPQYIVFNPNQIKSAISNNGEFSIKNNNISEYNKFNEELVMKAPNGQKSNLTKKQWQQVHTPEFKAWFGDWENDPEHSSKIIDENGEPLVVYHGTINWDEDSYPFYTFNSPDDSKRGGDFGLVLGAGVYFTKIKRRAHDFSGYYLKRNQIEEGTYGVQPDGLFTTFYPQLYEVFLNIKKPADGIEGHARTIKDRENKGFDGVIGGGTDEEIVVNRPNQIKSATDNNGDFDPNNENITK